MINLIKKFFRDRKEKKKQIIQKQENCNHDWFPVSFKMSIDNGLLWWLFDKGKVEFEAHGHVCSICGKECCFEVD